VHRLGTFVVCSALLACNVEPDQKEAAQEVVGKAVERTRGGLERGAEQAKDGLRQLERDYGPAARRDWERLEEAAREAWTRPPGEAPVSEAAEGLPDRWWERAEDVVTCPAGDDADAGPCSGRSGSSTPTRFGRSTDCRWRSRCPR
jgi:hypothetical protein